MNITKIYNLITTTNFLWKNIVKIFLYLTITTTTLKTTYTALEKTNNKNIILLNNNFLNYLTIITTILITSIILFLLFKKFWSKFDTIFFKHSLKNINKNNTKQKIKETILIKILLNFTIKTITGLFLTLMFYIIITNNNVLKSIYMESFNNIDNNTLLTLFLIMNIVFYVFEIIVPKNMTVLINNVKKII